METIKLEKGLEEIRKARELKFDESVELIVNLKKFDVKKTQINVFVELPHNIRDKKVCGFLEAKTDLIDTVPKAKFIGYKDKKKLKKLVRSYDFFIAHGPLMPAVATTFGRVLGPAGKMPSPKLGIIMSDSDDAIKEVVGKINRVTRIQTKEPSIKLVIGKSKMTNSDIAENIQSIYKSILKELPQGKDNVKSVMIKFTMGKPVRVEL